MNTISKCFSFGSSLSRPGALAWGLHGENDSEFDSNFNPYDTAGFLCTIFSSEELGWLIYNWMNESCRF